MASLLKRLALFLAAFAWTSSPVMADWVTKTAAPEKTAKPKAPQVRVARPALWVVSDADTTIYLFGTIHVLPERISWLNGKLAAAYRESDQLVTEIPETDPRTTQEVILKTAMLPRGDSLRSQLSPQDLVLLDRTLADYKMPANAVDGYEPWYAALLLANLPLGREQFTPENGIETQLTAKARETGQKHDALETSEYQLGLFDRLPRKVQIKYLHEVLVGLPRTRVELRQLVDYWAGGKVDNLARLINEDEQIPELAQVLIFNRNRQWADWIRRRLDKPGKVFVAVGAGHLAGAGSVQAYLAQMKVVSRRVQ